MRSRKPRVNPFFAASKKVMVRSFSEAREARVSQLLRRRHHPVYRSIADLLLQRGHSYMYIRSLVNFASELFELCRKHRTHGQVPMDKVQSLLISRTFHRYMEVILSTPSPSGGLEFYVVDEVLHIARYHMDARSHERAEARWVAERAQAAERKRRQRARERDCQNTPHRMPPIPPLEADLAMSRSSSSLREEDLDQDKDMSFEQMVAQAEARANAAEAAVGHKCPQAKRALTSLEVTELALAEERALTGANKVEAKRAGEARVVRRTPVRGTTPAKLAAWGYVASRVRGYGFTEGELNRAVEKVEAARTPLSNRAGAVVATILRWRAGTWSDAVAA